MCVLTQNLVPIAAVAPLAIGRGCFLSQTIIQLYESFVPLPHDEVDLESDGLSGEVQIERDAHVKQKQKTHAVETPKCCFTSVTAEPSFVLPSVSLSQARHYTIECKD